MLWRLWYCISINAISATHQFPTVCKTHHEAMSTELRANFHKMSLQYLMYWVTHTHHQVLWKACQWIRALSSVQMQRKLRTSAGQNKFKYISCWALVHILLRVAIEANHRYFPIVVWVDGFLVPAYIGMNRECQLCTRPWCDRVHSCSSASYIHAMHYA